MTTEPKSRLQFSLAALLVIVTIAALVFASITQLPDWIGAPVLAFITLTAAAERGGGAE